MLYTAPLPLLLCNRDLGKAAIAGGGEG